MIDWEQLPNGKWKKKNNKPFDEKKMKEVMSKKKFYCEDCMETYTLLDPCIHHLSDSPEHRKKAEEFKKKLKEGKVDTDHSQKSLYEDTKSG